MLEIPSVYSSGSPARRSSASRGVAVAWHLVHIYRLAHALRSEGFDLSLAVGPHHTAQIRLWTGGREDEAGRDRAGRVVDEGQRNGG